MKLKLMKQQPMQFKKITYNSLIINIVVSSLQLLKIEINSRFKKIVHIASNILFKKDCIKILCTTNC